jgi:hypothetical protein
MKYLLTLLLVYICIVPTNAQVWQWGHGSGGGSSGNIVNGVISDDNGYVYYCGTVRGTGMLDTIPYASGSDKWGFVMKTDSIGNMIWNQFITGLYSNTPYDVAIDGNGNVFVTGEAAHDTDFGGYIDVNDGDARQYLVKYDNNGNFIYVRTGYGEKPVRGYSIDVDENNNIYIAGEYHMENLWDTIYFDNLKLYGPPYTYSEVLLTKYDNAGNIQWIKTAGGANDDFATEVACDDMGNVYIGGQYADGQATFDAITVNGSGYYNYFVARYDYNGNLYWVRDYGGGNPSVRGLEADENGIILASGHFGTFLDNDTGQVASLGGNDYYLICLDSSGTELWNFAGGGTDNDQINSIVKDGSGNFMITGHHEDVWNLLNISGDHGIFSTAFIAKVSPTGNVLWYHASDADHGQCNAYNPVTKHYHIGGNFYSAAIFGNDTLIGNANTNGYVGQGSDTTTCLGVANAQIDTIISCFGDTNGVASVVITGGTGPYTYQWDANANNQTTAIASGLSAGTYNVTVTDNGCTYQSSIVLTEPVVLQSTIATNSLNCFGDTTGFASVNPTGGTMPYSYQWNAAANNQTTPVATGLGAGIYFVTITDGNGCTYQDTTTLSEPPLLIASTTSNPENGSCNGSIIASPTGGVSPYTYQWDAGAGNQTTATANNLCAGIYCVDVMDNNGCIFSICDTVNSTVGLQQNNHASSLSIYPNPATNTISLITSETVTAIALLGVTGKTIRTYPSYSTNLDVSELPAGVYLIKVIGEENTVLQRFVKQ